SVETGLRGEQRLVDELRIGALFGCDTGGASANAEVEVVAAVDRADWLLEVEQSRATGFAAERVGGGVVIAEDDVLTGCELGGAAGRIPTRTIEGRRCVRDDPVSIWPRSRPSWVLYRKIELLTLALRQVPAGVPTPSPYPPLLWL